MAGLDRSKSHESHDKSYKIVAGSLAIEPHYHRLAIMRVIVRLLYTDKQTPLTADTADQIALSCRDHPLLESEIESAFAQDLYLEPADRFCSPTEEGLKGTLRHLFELATKKEMSSAAILHVNLTTLAIVCLVEDSNFRRFLVFQPSLSEHTNSEPAFLVFRSASSTVRYLLRLAISCSAAHVRYRLSWAKPEDSEDDSPFQVGLEQDRGRNRVSSASVPSYGSARRPSFTRSPPPYHSSLWQGEMSVSPSPSPRRQTSLRLNSSPILQCHASPSSPISCISLPSPLYNHLPLGETSPQYTPPDRPSRIFSVPDVSVSAAPIALDHARTESCHLCSQESSLFTIDPCQHKICRKDLQRQMMSTDVLPVHCPACERNGSQNQSRISSWVAHVVLDSDQLIHYISLQLSLRSEEVDCPGCQHMFSIERKSFELPVMRCPRPECGIRFCRCCRSPLHSIFPRLHRCGGLRPTLE